MPCDESRLATSPDLPKSPYETGEALFTSTERDALVAALDLGLQPAWGPQPPKLHSGSTSRATTASRGSPSALGDVGARRGLHRAGARAHRHGRLGANGELSLARTRRAAHGAARRFHRLGVANDDWGAPLSFGASLANVLYARDEGFYYRTFGAELLRHAPAPLFGANVSWRLFAERQRSAGVEPNTQLSLGKAIGDARFTDNIAAAERDARRRGARSSARSFGEDPARLAPGLAAARRGRARSTDRRSPADDRLRAPHDRGDDVARPRLVRASRVTGSAGAIAGDAPTQRQFYVGGLQTVRGQFARATGPGYVGDAFWLTRTELGPKRVGFRPTVFFDAGWAGPRADWRHPGRPLTGAGVGVSFIDGLIRADRRAASARRSGRASTSISKRGSEPVGARKGAASSIVQLDVQNTLGSATELTRGERSPSIRDMKRRATAQAMHYRMCRCHDATHGVRDGDGARARRSS